MALVTPLASQGMFGGKQVKANRYGLISTEFGDQRAQDAGLATGAVEVVSDDPATGLLHPAEQAGHLVDALPGDPVECPGDEDVVPGAHVGHGPDELRPGVVG